MTGSSLRYLPDVANLGVMLETTVQMVDLPEYELTSIDRGNYLMQRNETVIDRFVAVRCFVVCVGIGLLFAVCIPPVQLLAEEVSDSQFSNSVGTPPKQIKQSQPSGDGVTPDNTFEKKSSLKQAIVVDADAFRKRRGDVGAKTGTRVATNLPAGSGLSRTRMPVRDLLTVSPVDPQPFESIHEVEYQDHLSMPRSNYFGLGPNDCCDEWSGFCDCQQKMFTRGCQSCGKRCCRGCR